MTNRFLVVQGYKAMNKGGRFALLLVLSLLGSSCIYLQNQANLKTTQDANTKFNDFRKTSATVYDAMLANQNALEKEVEDAERRVGAENDVAVANQLPNNTWKDLRAGIEDYNAALADLRLRLTNDLNSILAAEGLQPVESNHIDKALSRIHRTQEDAAASRNQLETDRVLFLSTIKAVPGFKDSKDPAQALKTSAATIKSAPVEVWKVEDDGRITMTTSAVGEQLKTELTQDKGEDLTSIIRERTVPQFDPASQPGQSIAILSLAADLAKAEASKANLQIIYYGQVEAISSEALAEYPENPPRAYLQTIDQLASETRADSTVLKSLNSFARENQRGNHDRDIENTVFVMQEFVLDQTVRREDLMAIDQRLAVMQHRHSIRISAENCKEHEALISRGLVGLKSYQENGITPEQVANLIRAAQTAAISIIAGAAV
jgi:hypothetical protein